MTVRSFFLQVGHDTRPRDRVTQRSKGSACVKEKDKLGTRLEGSRDFRRIGRTDRTRNYTRNLCVLRFKGSSVVYSTGRGFYSFRATRVRLLTENAGPPCQRACTGSSIGSPESASSFLKQIIGVSEAGKRLLGKIAARS